MTKKSYKWTNILTAGGLVLGVLLILIVLVFDRQLGYADLSGSVVRSITGLLSKQTEFSTDSIPQAITPLPTDSISPNDIPSGDSVQPQANSTNSSTTPHYQNGGWYPVGPNGQAEQYENGQFSSSSQQNAQQTQAQSNQTTAVNPTQEAVNTQNQSACLTTTANITNSCMSECQNSTDSLDSSCNGSAQCLSQATQQDQSCIANCTSNQRALLQSCSQY